MLIGIEINAVKTIKTALPEFCSNGNRPSVGFQRHGEISTSGRHQLPLLRANVC